MVPIFEVFSKHLAYPELVMTVVVVSRQMLVEIIKNQVFVEDWSSACFLLANVRMWTLVIIILFMMVILEIFYDGIHLDT